MKHYTYDSVAAYFQIQFNWNGALWLVIIRSPVPVAMKLISLAHIHNKEQSILNTCYHIHNHKIFIYHTITIHFLSHFAHIR